VKLRSYKFLILPVVQQLDDDGTVMGEGQTEQPDVAFGVRGLKEYAESFEQVLAQREAEMNGGTNGQEENGSPSGLQSGAGADRETAGHQQGPGRGNPRRRS